MKLDESHNNSDLFRAAVRLRIVFVLTAADHAGITPISILSLHTLLYLCNLLAPVADLPPLDGKVLKRQGGPFYPEFQAEVDRLTGVGILRISNVGYVREPSGWRLNGSYALNQPLASRVVSYAATFSEFFNTIAFSRELALAVGALSEQDAEHATNQDATYSDSAVDVGGVVDFGEWRTKNYSLNAARIIRDLAGMDVTVAEQLNFYVRHLYQRMQNDDA
jgi:hypothetical protein